MESLAPKDGQAFQPMIEETNGIIVEQEKLKHLN